MAPIEIERLSEAILQGMQEKLGPTRGHARARAAWIDVDNPSLQSSSCLRPLAAFQARPTSLVLNLSSAVAQQTIPGGTLERT